MYFLNLIPSENICYRKTVFALYGNIETIKQVMTVLTFLFKPEAYQKTFAIGKPVFALYGNIELIKQLINGLIFPSINMFAEPAY